MYCSFCCLFPLTSTCSVNVWERVTEHLFVERYNVGGLWAQLGKNVVKYIKLKAENWKILQFSVCV